MSDHGAPPFADYEAGFRDGLRLGMEIAGDAIYQAIHDPPLAMACRKVSAAIRATGESVWTSLGLIRMADFVDSLGELGVQDES